METRGGGRAVIVHTACPLIACGGEGEARAPTLVLHTLGMHVDFSSSYLRFAEAVSFDIKKLRRSCTHTMNIHVKYIYYLYMFFYLPKLDVPLLNFFNFQYANYLYLIGKIYYVTGHIQLATHNFDTCCFRYFL